MRKLAAAGALLVLVLASTPEVLGLPGKPSRVHRGHVGTSKTPAQRAATLLRKHVGGRGATGRRPAAAQRARARHRRAHQRPADGTGTASPSRLPRTDCGRESPHEPDRPARLLEHESVDGAPFWRRIERFYPPAAVTGGWERHLLGVARHERRERRPRVDAQPAAPAERPHARVARNRRLGGALPVGPGCVRRPIGDDCHRRFRRQRIGGGGAASSDQPFKRVPLSRHNHADGDATPDDV